MMAHNVRRYGIMPRFAVIAEIGFRYCPGLMPELVGVPKLP